MDFSTSKYSKEEIENGIIILIDKPLNWSSFQVVNKIRWKIKCNLGLKKIKVGHTGTLDPLATGLLLICTGRMTKQIEKLQNKDKSYTGTFVFGNSTPSFDLETSINQSYDYRHITLESIEKIIPEFLGEIIQTPPIYSAIKKNGKRLFEFARKAEKVKINSRIVNVSKFKITRFKLPEVDFLIKCSKGTYIRSIANDFGKALNSGAYLKNLKRIANGEYKIEDALKIKKE
jgi:tRNA pseudouridine55 synthase